jgi:hypothetical protein
MNLFFYYDLIIKMASEYPKFNSFRTSCCNINPTLVFDMAEKWKLLASLNLKSDDDKDYIVGSTDSRAHKVGDYKLESFRVQMRRQLSNEIYTGFQMSTRHNAVVGFGYNIQLCNSINIESFFYAGKNIENMTNIAGYSLALLFELK